VYSELSPERLAYAGWLETLPWNYFLTITMREPVPAHRAESVLNAIGKQLCATHKPECLFLGAEAHLSTAIHFHGLYRDTLPNPEAMPAWWMKMQRAGIWETLFNTYGRSSVEAIRGPKDVSRYVAKYCTKELGSYGLYGRQDWEEAAAQARTGSVSDYGQRR